MPGYIHPRLWGAQVPTFSCEVVHREELTPERIVAVKRAAREIARTDRVSYHTWHEFLTGLVRDCPAYFVDGTGELYELPMSAFETDGIKYWFRDAVMPAAIKPTTIRAETEMRWIILASVMKAYFPNADWKK